MKINDYDFHKKLYKLVAWCKPNAYYTLNRDQCECIMSKTSSLLRFHSYLAFQNTHFFSIQDDWLTSNYIRIRLKKCIDFNHFANCIAGVTARLTDISTTDMISELMLDPSNLVERSG